jgi:hypothetical protein
VFQRKTQTQEYWGPEFRFSEDDVSHLYEFLTDKGRPCSSEELALAVIDFRCWQEEAHIRDELAKGTLYQPKTDYEIGQRVVFPMYDFAPATVIEKRLGSNPEHGEFSVIKVQFEGKRRAREFAAGLGTPHKLNIEGSDQTLLHQDGLLTSAALKSSFAPDLADRLSAYLQQGSDRSFIQSNGRWLLREMLADISVGQLNIAEALIEMAGRPLSIDKLVSELDLPRELSSDVLEFSLNHALQSDERFDNIGAKGAYHWYLRRLEPQASILTPSYLQFVPQRYDRSLLSAELLRIEWELGDEWSDEAVEAPAASPSVSLVLTYPHLRSGTLPLSFRTRGLFPAGETGRSMVTLIDGRWGQRFTGWVVFESRYIVGLHDWYEQHKVPVGAFIVLERGSESGDVVVDIRPRRMRREWARLARVEGDRLLFEMRKLPISCDYDELMVVDALDPMAVQTLSQSSRQSSLSLDAMVEALFLELLKLNPDGKVHAKTLYSALNLLRRLPPGPIFALLSGSRKYRLEGGGYWSLT